MSMTAEERDTKFLIMQYLDDQGYPRYADELVKYDLNLTSDPRTIGFMEPAKGRIVINRGLDDISTSLVIRHEIMHYYLEHQKRLLAHFAETRGIDIEDASIEQQSDLEEWLYSNDIYNIAADYEISNRAYTEKDKIVARNIQLNSQTIEGLVTEIDHPDWIDLSVEEMYDKLIEEYKKNPPKPPEKPNPNLPGAPIDIPLKIIEGELVDPSLFVDKDGNNVQTF